MAKLAKEDVTKMQIKRIEKEIRDTPYHKATEHHIGRLRAKLSSLKDKSIEGSSKKGGGGGYSVKKQGDATIVLVGPPSVGKSTLLNALTNARSKIAPYAFTTVTVIPGMMYYRDAEIQILDVPGLIEGAEEGKGRGREVLSVVRSSDLLIIMTEVDKKDSIESINNALERNGIRLNRKKPKVVIDKKTAGGIIVHTNIKQSFDSETIKSTAGEFGIKNAEITIKEKLSLDELFDSFSKNKVYIPTIELINKIDLKDEKQKDEKLYISAEKGINIEYLKDKMWEKLDLVRVYLVRRDEAPSNNHPLIVKSHTKLKDIVEEIGEEFAEDKKRALVWGAGAKFPAQEVSLAKQVVDGMQIRFI